MRLTSSKHYLEWLPSMAAVGGRYTPVDQSAEERVDKNALDPAPHQVGLSDPAETMAVKPPVLD